MNEVRNVLLGIELGRTSSQLSYFDRALDEPVSVLPASGSNRAEIPTKLYKEAGREVWHLASDIPADREGMLEAGGLLEAAESGEGRMLDGRTYESCELLALFFREIVRLCGLPDPLKSIRGICVTTEHLQGGLAPRLREALVMLGFDPEICLIQDYEESFYYYGYSQKAGVSYRKMALLRFSGEEVSFQSMGEKRSGRLAYVTVSEPKRAALPSEETARDEALAAAVSGWIGTEHYSGIMLTGEGFSPSWAKKSVKAMSRSGARVFGGGNLFVRGACYAACEKLERHAFGNRVYLGPDQVNVSAGIDLISVTAQKFFPLIRAGVNWYDNSTQISIIPDQRRDLLVTLVSMDGRTHRNEHLWLEGLPERPNRATRLEIRARCTDLHHAVIEVEDLGFGELYEATHLVWRLELDLELRKEPSEEDGRAEKRTQSSAMP